MIRVSVPIDLHAVMRDASTAFALATPLRVDDVLTQAVHEALGPRAPDDKRQRVLHSVRAGLDRGEYRLEIDGRPYVRRDDVVVAHGIIDVRFFLRRDAFDAA